VNILVIELTPDEVSIDENIFSDPHKDEFIYEHLLHYCSYQILLKSHRLVWSGGERITKI